MDIQKLAVTLLLLGVIQKFEVVHSTLPDEKFPHSASADPKGTQHERQNENSFGMSFDNNDRVFPLPSVNVASFPKLLDLRTLQNMPMVILHPSKPINLQISTNGDRKNQQSLIGNMLKMLGSAAQANSNSFKSSASAPSNIQKTGIPNEEQRNVHNTKNSMIIPQEGPQNDHNHQQEVQDSDAISRVPSSGAVKHSARGLQTMGWLEKFRGTFSHMLPQMSAFQARPTHFGQNSPGQVFFNMAPSKAPNNLFGSANPYVASNSNPVFLPFPGSLDDFRIQQHRLNPFHSFHTAGGDFFQEGSHQFPSVHPLHPPGIIRPGIPFGGGRRQFPFPSAIDQMTSASGIIPHRVLPPANFGRPAFVIPPPYWGSRPFRKNKNTPIAASSAAISGAFADFAASEQEPDVVEGFDSVGSSINKFLNMMGLGVSGIAKGFGDFTDSSAREIDGRSLDFFPGYGNQAMLDDMDDMDVFQEDITEQYQRNQPKTTKAPQKLSVGTPKPAKTGPAEKSNASMNMSATKPNVLPNSVPKSSSGMAKEIQKVMDQKTNGSSAGKTSHLEEIKTGAVEKAEKQGKHGHKSESDSHHGLSGGMPNPVSAHLPIRAPMKNYAEPNKVMSLPPSPQPPLPPSPQAGPQGDFKRPIHVSQNQKPVHMGHANVHPGGGANVPNNPNLHYYNANSSRDSSQMHQKNMPLVYYPDVSHYAKPPVHNGVNGKHLNGRDNEGHRSGNKTATKMEHSRSRVYYFHTGDSHQLRDANQTFTSSSFKPQTPQIKEKMSQTDVKSGTNSKDSEKKSVSTKPSNETSYASAHSLPGPESSELLNTDDVRPWIPVSTGHGYVERRPVSPHAITSEWKEHVKERVQLSFRKKKEDSETSAKKGN